MDEPGSMMRAMGRAIPGFVLGIASCPVQASDFTPLMYMLVGVVAIVFAVVFGVAWFLTRRIARLWLKVLIRVAVIIVFWTPVQQGGAGYWWPAAFAWGNAIDDPAGNLFFIATVIALTVVLWLVAMWLVPARESTRSR